MTNNGYSWDTASTTNRPGSQKEESYIAASSSTAASSSSSTTASREATRVRACAREDGEAAARAAMLRGQYVDVCDYYTRSFHRAIAPAIQREIATRIRDGMSAEVLMAAIDDTVQAPRPSWAYLRAILRNLDLDQVKTMRQWIDRKQRFQSSINPALNYAQRTYTDDMFGESFYVDLDKYADEVTDQ